MSQIKDAILETAEPTAMKDFAKVAAAVRDCYFSGDEDLESAVVARLVEDGMPAGLLSEGSRGRALVVHIANGLNTALLSFGALRSAAIASLSPTDSRAVVA